MGYDLSDEGLSRMGNRSLHPIREKRRLRSGTGTVLLVWFLALVVLILIGSATANVILPVAWFVASPISLGLTALIIHGVRGTLND